MLSLQSILTPQASVAYTIAISYPGKYYNPFLLYLWKKKSEKTTPSLNSFILAKYYYQPHALTNFRKDHLRIFLSKKTTSLWWQDVPGNTWHLPPVVVKTTSATTIVAS
jgi:hypothetical protein